MMRLATILTKLKSNRNRVTLVASLVFFIAGGYVTYEWISANVKQISGSAACINLVKRIEGANFKTIYTLNCTLEPRTIGNSNLGAQYYSYSGRFKDPYACNDSIDNASFPPLPMCPGGNGVVLSDGQRYVGLGGNNKIDDRPYAYDECYAGTGIDMLDPPVPTTRDLYFYKGDLWDRNVYKDVRVKTPIGNCVVNGTTLTHYPVGQAFGQVTNVVVSYPGFPRDCSGVPIGSEGDDFYKCVSLVTAARADLAVCQSGLDIVQTKDYKIAGYKQGTPGTPTAWCEDAYVQRTAALNKCDAIIDGTLRTECTPLVSQPYALTTRVFGTI